MACHADPLFRRPGARAVPGGRVRAADAERRGARSPSLCRRGAAGRRLSLCDRRGRAARPVGGGDRADRRRRPVAARQRRGVVGGGRSEEHTSELQSLMRISYAVFCLKKKKKKTKKYSTLLTTEQNA